MKDLTKISGPRLEAEIKRATTVRNMILDATIAAGMGEMRHSEIVELAKGSSLLSKVNLARRYVEACTEFHAAHEEMDARKRYHGGTKPIKRAV